MSSFFSKTIFDSVDIDGGTIDNTDITVGNSKTLDVSAGALTLNSDINELNNLYIRATPSGSPQTIIISTASIDSSGWLTGDDIPIYNVGIGYHALNSLTSGVTNTALGFQAGEQITSGNDNVCIGSYAGYDSTKGITTGARNILIGRNVQTHAAGGDNQIVIGADVDGIGNHYAVIGNSDIQRVYMDSDGAAVIYANGTIQSSDSRIKENIVDIDDAVSLQQVRDIPCKSYTYKDTNRRGTSSTPGFIAQEVETVFPVAVSTETQCIPNEYRLLTDYTLVETTTLVDSNIAGRYYWKLTVNDLTDLSETNKYRFTFSNDTNFDYSNGSYESKIIQCIEGESTAFLLTKQWTHIFLYGKEITDFKKLNKDKIFTLHHSAIQQLDKTMTAEQAKIATLETQVATLQTELAAIKTHLGL